MKRLLRFLKLALLAAGLMVLSACGSGGGSGGSPSQASGETGCDGSDNVTQTPVAMTQIGSAAILSVKVQVGNAVRLIGTLQSLLPWRVAHAQQAGNAAIPRPPKTLQWLSQHTADCNDFSKNGYCGFASVLMGATYLNASNLFKPVPVPLGYSDEVGSWIQSNVKMAFPNNKDYANCGGNGIVWPDISNFATSLGIKAEQFPPAVESPPPGKIEDDRNQAELWIADALANDYPVVARVHYQGLKCTGRKGAEEDYYKGGSVTQEMLKCYDDATPKGELGHWVLVSEIDQDSVLVYDPDPFATSPTAGIRRYTKTSFFSVLQTNINRNNRPRMYKLFP